MRTNPSVAFLRHALTRTTLLIIVQLSIGFSCSAVCPKPHPKPNAEFFHSDIVFAGTLISQREIRDKEGFIAGFIYRLHVDRLFRGQAGAVIRVYTSNDSVRMPLDAEQKYLLFAWRWPGRKRLNIDSCGNSALLEKARDTIRQLEEIPRAGNAGEIEGEIFSYDPKTSVSGIRVAISGMGKSYSTVTDGQGNFHILVSPGRYSLRLLSSDLAVNVFDFSYDNPDNFVVHRGGSAQVALEVRRK